MAEKEAFESSIASTFVVSHEVTAGHARDGIDTTIRCKHLITADSSCSWWDA